MFFRSFDRSTVCLFACLSIFDITIWASEKIHTISLRCHVFAHFMLDLYKPDLRVTSSKLEMNNVSSLISRKHAGMGPFWLQAEKNLPVFTAVLAPAQWLHVLHNGCTLSPARRVCMSWTQLKTKESIAGDGGGSHG